MLPNYESTFLQDHIKQFVATLREMHIDEPLAKRLEVIAEELAADEIDSIGSDVLQIYNPLLFMEHVRVAALKNVRWLNGFELLRNVLVLFPILFTWYALSQATNAYMLALNANPALVSTPFLLQWEQSFNGLLPAYLTFSRIAYLDAAIILIIILLTGFVIQRSTMLNEQAERAANVLASDLNNLVWRINKYVSTRKQGELETAEKRSLALLASINTFVEAFKQHSLELEKVIAAQGEHLEQIAGLRQSEALNLKNASDELKNTTGAFIENENKLTPALISLQQASTALAEEAARLNEIQSGLFQSLQAETAQKISFAGALKEMDEHQQAVMEKLVAQIGSSLEKTGDLVGAVQALTATTRNLALEQGEFRVLVEEQQRATTQWLQLLEKNTAERDLKL